jgi:hypothetical protein
MGNAIGQVLPLAVGVAIIPMPIVAVVLMLISRRARSNGSAFRRWRSRPHEGDTPAAPKWMGAIEDFTSVKAGGVAAPVVIYFARGEQAKQILDSLKNWMASKDAVIMAVLCLMIGSKLAGDAISGLST